MCHIIIVVQPSSSITGCCSRRATGSSVSAEFPVAILSSLGTAQSSVRHWLPGGVILLAKLMAFAIVCSRLGYIPIVIGFGCRIGDLGFVLDRRLPSKLDCELRVRLGVVLQALKS